MKPSRFELRGPECQTCGRHTFVKLVTFLSLGRGYVEKIKKPWPGSVELGVDLLDVLLGDWVRGEESGKEGS